MKFRTKYEPRLVGLSFKDTVSLTDQQFKDECSIEGIVKRYGILPPPSVQPISADVSEIGDFAECMERVQEGLDHFQSLPSEIRSRFGNDPKAYFEFVLDGKNQAEAIRLGLMVERKEEVTAVDKLNELIDITKNSVTAQQSKQA